MKSKPTANNPPPAQPGEAELVTLDEARRFRHQFDGMAHGSLINRLLNTVEHYARADLSRATGEAGEGVAIIAAERRRQLEKEGWTPEHDDEHRHGEMAIAAACYAVEGTDASVQYPDDDPEGSGWPWGREWFKPKDDIRDLARAGALIAAEIDRLRRTLGQVPRRRGEGRRKQ